MTRQLLAVGLTCFFWIVLIVTADLNPLDFINSNTQRICYLDASNVAKKPIDKSAKKPIDESSLQKMCTHIVIEPGIELPIPGALVSFTLTLNSSAKQLLDKFRSLTTPKTPLFLVRIGSQTSKTNWITHMLGERKKFLVDALKKTLAENNLNGLSLGVTHRFFRGEAGILRIFIEELKSKLGSTMVVLCEVPVVSAFPFFPFKDMASAVGNNGFLVLHTHQLFNVANKITHPSALWNSSLLFPANRFTIETLVDRYISSSAPPERLAISISARPVVLHMPERLTRTDTEFINDEGAVTIVDQIASLQELCQFDPLAFVQFVEALGVPRFIRNLDEVVTFDNRRSVLTKGITAFAVFHPECDDPQGKCPGGKPHTLLQALVTSQVNTKNQVKLPSSQCATVARFPIVCSYKLPTYAEAIDGKLHTVMLPSEIPMSICDEVLVTGLSVDHTGKPKMDHIMRPALKWFTVDRLPRFRDRQVIASLKCDMGISTFNFTMQTAANRTTMINTIYRFFTNSRPDGILLDCHHLQTGHNKELFATFLKELNAKVRTETDSQDCSRISISVPTKIQGLATFYDIKVLNTLRYVFATPPREVAKKTRYLFPLYNVNQLRAHPAKNACWQKKNELLQDESFSLWLQSGLHTRRVVMLLAPYGYSFPITDKEAEHNIEGLVATEFSTIISREKICSEQYGSDNEFKAVTHYDVSATSAVTKNDWISFENEETITSKIRYAAARQMGGVGIANINEDDYKGVCAEKQGKKIKKVLPVLEEIRRQVGAVSDRSLDAL